MVYSMCLYSMSVELAVFIFSASVALLWNDWGVGWGGLLCVACYPHAVCAVGLLRKPACLPCVSLLAVFCIFYTA